LPGNGMILYTKGSKDFTKELEGLSINANFEAAKSF
jgi:hypothetical protein